MDAANVVAKAPFRLIGYLHLSDQVAGCRIPPRELDAGGFADQAASAVATDEIFRPQRLAVGQLDADAGVILRKTRHLTSAIDRHRQLVDPAGEYPLDMVLPQREPVVMSGGKVADVQTDPGEPSDLRHQSLREEPISDSALIENLDGARVQTACARPDEVLAGAPLDNGNVDVRQRQLAGQHQSGRARAHDQDIGIRHGRHLSRRSQRQTSARPRSRRRDEHAHVSTEVSGSYWQSRGFAILELLYFGPIFKSADGYADAGSRKSTPRSDPVSLGSILTRY